MTERITFGWPLYALALIVRAIATIAQTILYAAYFSTLLVIAVALLIWIGNGFAPW